jgi:hypothetical protein
MQAQRVRRHPIDMAFRVRERVVQENGADKYGETEYRREDETDHEGREWVALGECQRGDMQREGPGQSALTEKREEGRGGVDFGPMVVWNDTAAGRLGRQGAKGEGREGDQGRTGEGCRGEKRSRSEYQTRSRKAQRLANDFGLHGRLLSLRLAPRRGGCLESNLYTCELMSTVEVVESKGWNNNQEIVSVATSSTNSIP